MSHINKKVLQSTSQSISRLIEEPKVLKKANSVAKR